MKVINVKVIPNAKKNSICKEGKRFKVHVTAPAISGKANKALIEVLAEFFKTKKRNIKIIKGEKSRAKIIGVKSFHRGGSADADNLLIADP